MRVCRMHELMPDDYTICSASTGAPLGQFTLPDMSGRRARKIRSSSRPTICSTRSALLTLARSACTTSRSTFKPWSRTTANRSILRPSTCCAIANAASPVRRFRRLLHKAPVTSFEELTDNPQWAAELRRVYNNDLEMVDTHVA